jgi:hypothetical protein
VRARELHLREARIGVDEDPHRRTPVLRPPACERDRADEQHVCLGAHVLEEVDRHADRVVARAVDPPVAEAERRERVVDEAARVREVGRERVLLEVPGPRLVAALLEVPDLVTERAQPGEVVHLDPRAAAQRRAADRAGQDDPHAARSASSKMVSSSASSAVR